MAKKNSVQSSVSKPVESSVLLVPEQIKYPVVSEQAVVSASVPNAVTSAPIVDTQQKPPGGKDDKRMLTGMIIGVVVLLSIAGLIAGIFGVKRVLDDRKAADEADGGDGQDDGGDQGEDLADGGDDGEDGEDGGDNTDGDGEDDGENPPAGDNPLATVCASAINDYENWEKTDDMIIWKSEDYLSILFRATLQSAPGGAVVTDSEDNWVYGKQLISDNLIGYSVELADAGWKVGTINLTNLNANIIYNFNEGVQSLEDVSFVDDHTFVALVRSSENYRAAADYELLYIDTEAPLNDVVWQKHYAAEVAGQNSDLEDLHIALSPKKNYVYVLDSYLPGDDGNIIRVISLREYTDIGQIQNATNPVWVGNTHILYRSTAAEGGVYLYDVQYDTSEKIDGIDSDAMYLEFSPLDGGIVTYDLNPSVYEATGHIIRCDTLASIASIDHGTVESIVDENTAGVYQYVRAAPDEDWDYDVSSTSGWNYRTDEFTKLDVAGEIGFRPESVWSKY